MLENIQTQLYHLERFANLMVSLQLSHLSMVSLGVVFLAGLLTSVTPCMLSMLPITVAYIGGYEDKGRLEGIIQSIWFCLGLATTLAGLGIIAAVFGRVYGQVGIGLPILVSLIAIIMGLNLLEVISLPLPSIGTTDWIKNDFPPALRSFLLGLTFGLVASPCSTPVLATLLAWVASTQDLILGASLLLAYTLGYVLPLIIAGTFTATIKRLLALRQWSAWINPASGVLLIGFGMFSLLSRLPQSIF
jgi:cytochrome c-type biogenesis protein